MYIVKSGEVNIVDDQGQILTRLPKGSVFGELGLFGNEPRHATALASDEHGSSLWKLSSSSFSSSMKSSMNEIVLQTNPEYQTYVDKKSLKVSIKKCSIFKDFGDDDIERCMASMEMVPYSDGEILCKEGDTGDSMYFVKSGVFDCITSKGDIVASVGKGQYFGELALVFKKPRALTIQARGDDCAAWRLSEEDFNKAVQDYPIGEAALSLLKAQYKTESAFETLSQMTFQDFKDLARQYSKPKKQSVSLHSNLALANTASSFLLLVPLLAPGFDQTGCPQLLDYSKPLSSDLYMLIEITTLLQAIIGMMGIFRLPNRSPRIRVSGMMSGAVGNMQLALIPISSLNGTGVYLFDAFTLPFKIFSLIVNAWTIWVAYDFLDCVLFEDASIKNSFQSLPGPGGRLGQFFLGFTLLVGNVAAALLFLPLLEVKEDVLPHLSSFGESFGAIWNPHFTWGLVHSLEHYSLKRRCRTPRHLGSIQFCL